MTHAFEERKRRKKKTRREKHRTENHYDYYRKSCIYHRNVKSRVLSVRLVNALMGLFSSPQSL